MDFEHDASSQIAADVFGGLTVEQAIHPQGFSGHLRPDDCLGDMADVLASTKRTAMGVTDVENDILGMVTMNDIMRAYFEGVSAKTKLSEWLRMECARAPEARWLRLEVGPNTLLSDVAQKMLANTLRGDCACHHIVVKDESGVLRGVASSHDLVEAFRCHEVWKHSNEEHQEYQEYGPEGTVGTTPDAEDEMAVMMVRDIMKDKDHVFACESFHSLKLVLKTLLVTRQNFVFVTSSSGLFGFVTARDMVKAFADAIPLESCVADFLKAQPPEKTHRTIMSDARAIEAAEDMTKHGVDHLIVIRPDDSEAVGVVSSLDFVLHTKAKRLVVEAPAWPGPSIGDVLHEHTNLTALCSNETTLGLVCARLLAASQTSVMIGSASTAHVMLTESSLVRAFVRNFTKEDTVGDLLYELGEHQLPNYLQVPPSVHLTDAAAMMLHAIQPGHSCHHLVVRAVTGGCLGVFSALDVVRALSHLSSQLDAASLGVDVLTVGSVMKPVHWVPTCETSETLKDVLGEFEKSGQTASVIMEGESALGLITPRCALHGLSSGVSPTITVGEWMRTRQLPEGPREVTCDMPVLDAANLMREFSLHHLLVVQETGGAPAGVLSALDIVRGVVSMHTQCPFMTLRWLHRLGVPTFFPPQDRAVRRRKRRAGDAQEAAPLAKVPREEESAAARAEAFGA